MFIKDIEESKFGSIRRSINSKFIREIIVTHHSVPDNKYALRFIMAGDKSNDNQNQVLIKFFNNELSALAAYEDLMDALHDEGEVWDAEEH